MVRSVNSLLFYSDILNVKQVKDVAWDSSWDYYHNSASDYYQSIFNILKISIVINIIKKLKIIVLLYKLDKFFLFC